MRPVHVLVAACTLVGLAFGQQTSVVNSPHNLSAGGPGPVRATMESEVCIFCHAPHNASPIRPLWNRSMPSEAYSIYASRSLDAKPGQPTGVSKMCLSCHDGTIALGSVVSRGTPIGMAGGVTTMPAGRSNIGTDLRDDHPISFRYDTALASKDRKVRSPSALPHEVRLDSNAELQCTTCHDAHNNARGHFLVMHNSNSQLCTSCHQMGTTSVPSHRDCAACHQPHTAPSGPYLLSRATVTETCLRCHDGLTPGAADIASEMGKISVHDTGSPVEPGEPFGETSTCTDCHDPHTMAQGHGTAPSAHPSMGRVGGVNISGSPVNEITFEYEACFECHADGNRRQVTISRRATQNNTRLQFSPSAVSFHPVQGPGRNPIVPSLRPGLSTSSVIYCSDCHASENSRSMGGSGPRGVHGSNFAPLLSARYETDDYTSESASAYALCYRCHDRASILSNASFSGHSRHIVDLKTPCAACHDAHGIAASQGTVFNNSNLINFATAIVFPDRATGRLEFRDTGMFSGECYLSCHGVNHSPMRYSQTSPVVSPSYPRSGVPRR